MGRSIGTITLGTRTFEIEDTEEIKVTVDDYDEEKEAGYVEFSGDTINIGPAGLLLTDPTYVADVFNEFQDPSVAYLWQNSIMLATEGFGSIVEIGGDIIFFYGLEDLVEKEPTVLSLLGQNLTARRISKPRYERWFQQRKGTLSDRLLANSVVWPSDSKGSGRRDLRPGSL